MYFDAPTPRNDPTILFDLMSIFQYQRATDYRKIIINQATEFKVSYISLSRYQSSEFLNNYQWIKIID